MKKIILSLLVLLGLQTQAQIMPCDSISYTTSSTLNYPLGVTGVANIPGTVSWSWTVCNANTCYSSTGVNAYFGQVSLTDTLKVCYDVIIDINGVTYVCTGCDSLVYNPNSYQWEVSAVQPTAVTEVKISTSPDKMYDILGRELTSTPIGKMYIRNNRLYISK